MLVIATEEDGIAIPVGLDQSAAAAAFDEAGRECTPDAQPATDMAPVRFVALWRLEDRGPVEEQDGVTEAAAFGMHDQVDGATPAGVTEMVIEPQPVDADDRSGSLEARTVCGVAAVSKGLGDRLERSGSDRVELDAGPGHRSGTLTVVSAAACAT